MGWETYKVEQQRLQLIQMYNQGEHTMTDLCRHFGISRKTGYKWYHRFLENGETGLSDLPKAPHQPNTYYTKTQIDEAIDLKLKHRKWGPKKIHAILEKLHPNENYPSPTRLYEIFKGNGLIIPRRLRNRVPATGPLITPNASNDTWAIDFKGWFLTGDGKKCEPLTITDSYSRYLIRCIHLDKHPVDYVWPILDGAFREYGLPNRLRSDNGPPFGSCGIGRLTRLSVNLIKAGVTPEWIDPGHPEQNGVHERFHLTLKQEIAQPPKQTLDLQIEAINHFCDEYNFKRPHEALNMNAPGDIYQQSTRKWNGILQSPEYDRAVFDVRKVEKIGQVNWKGTRIFISETLQGENVGIKMNEIGKLECYYGSLYLGYINENNKIEKPKVSFRRQR